MSDSLPVRVSAEVVSVNRALPREIEWKGRKVRTGFFKTPSVGSFRVGVDGIEGDASADTQVHGGPRQAVYAYPVEHYEYWSRELEGVALPWGSFGENLSLRGVTEGDVAPGDLLETRAVTLEVTKPRTPCFKLNLRFDREDMVRRFAAAGRSGFYLAVLRPGLLAVGERLVHRPTFPRGPSIRDVYASRMHRAPDPASELDDV
jgi:MOSC domain-containing protein YiiM